MLWYVGVLPLGWLSATILMGALLHIHGYMHTHPCGSARIHMHASSSRTLGGSQSKVVVQGVFLDGPSGQRGCAASPRDPESRIRYDMGLDPLPQCTLGSWGSGQGDSCLRPWGSPAKPGFSALALGTFSWVCCLYCQVSPSPWAREVERAAGLEAQRATLGNLIVDSAETP